jgi:hypothetical protein
MVNQKEIISEMRRHNLPGDRFLRCLNGNMRKWSLMHTIKPYTLFKRPKVAGILL